MRGLTVALFVCGGLIAVLDTMIPAFIGRVVGLVVDATHRRRCCVTMARHCWAWRRLLLIVRPLSFMAHTVLVNQIVNPGFSNMIRWQNHWHVVRQSWTFFQNDFAGRIANRVLQTGPALRESLVMAFDAAWYIIVYGSSALAAARPAGLAADAADAGLVRLLRRHAALFRAPAARPVAPVSEMRSNLTGRVVDSYTNILTVKLFARARDEDAFVRDADRRPHRRHSATRPG